METYRPIYILPSIDKIFEKTLQTQYVTFLENKNLLAENQNGVRKGCGTDKAMVSAVNHICEWLDNGYSDVGSIFYNFTGGI